MNGNLRILFAISFALTCFEEVSGQEEKVFNQETRDLIGLITPLLAEIEEMPPLEMEYDVGFELDDGSFMRRRHKFLQSGKMWREETREVDGTLISVITYDGERYYCYDPVGRNLHVTRVSEEPEYVRISVFNAFLNNPFYHWAFPFFLQSQPGIQPRSFVRAGVWSDVLTEFTMRDIDSINGGKRMLFDAPHLQFETEFVDIGAGSWRSGEIILRHKNVASGKFEPFQAQIKLTGWHSVKLGEHSIAFPREVVGTTRYNDGREMVGGDQWIRLIEGSIKQLPKDVNASIFRVPLSSVPDPQIKE